MFKIWSDKQAEGSAGVLPGRCMIGGWCMSGYQRTRSSSTTDFLFPNKEVLGRESRLIEKAPKWRIKGGEHLIGVECWTIVFAKLTFFWTFFYALAAAFFELLERTSVHSFSCSSSRHVSHVPSGECHRSTDENRCQRWSWSLCEACKYENQLVWRRSRNKNDWCSEISLKIKHSATQTSL